MIYIYTLQDLLTPANRRHVHPLLFDLFYYEQTHPKIWEHYQMVAQPEQADAFLFPVDWNQVPLQDLAARFNAFYQLAQGLGKKCHVYTGGDYGKSFTKKDMVVWRNTAYRSDHLKETIILPSFINDPIGSHIKDFQVLEKQDVPCISFTGFATDQIQENLRYALSFIKQRIKSLLANATTDAPRYFNAAQNRFKIMKFLEAQPDVATDFIYRERYRAGAVTEEQRTRTTQEFFDNLNASPYTLCVRGAGNFSVRFYEALACGRIPVVLDTDIPLPLAHELSWEEHIILCQNVQDIPVAVKAFHHQQTAQSFKNYQIRNRQLYLNELVRHEFFVTLALQPSWWSL